MLSKNTLQFLEDLKANNNRDWFLANKKRYEEYKKDYHALIADFLEVMKPKDAALKMLEVKELHVPHQPRHPFFQRQIALQNAYGYLVQ